MLDSLKLHYGWMDGFIHVEFIIHIVYQVSTVSICVFHTAQSVPITCEWKFCLLKLALTALDEKHFEEPAIFTMSYLILAGSRFDKIKSTTLMNNS